MKKLLLITILLIGLVGCTSGLVTPTCPCSIIKIEYATSNSTKMYRVTFKGEDGDIRVIYTDSVYSVDDILIY